MCIFVDSKHAKTQKKILFPFVLVLFLYSFVLALFLALLLDIEKRHVTLSEEIIHSHMGGEIRLPVRDAGD